MTKRREQAMGKREEAMAERRNEALRMAGEIGDLLRHIHGAAPMLGWDDAEELALSGGTALLPGDGSKVADDIVLLVAEMLQAWLDAGSEREVTEEEIGEAMRDHCRGWSAEANPG